MLNELAGEKLDKECVDALVGHMDDVLEIQKRFKESL
jgi:HD-GYP domain-containing protein (c-di-GMP phosphodiesterase class II)